jgi:hypothetical protein
MAVTSPPPLTVLNAPEQVNRRMQSGRISRAAPWLVLPLRTVLFPLIQAALAGIFLLSGRANAWEEASAWWPVYLVLANGITFVILLTLVRREGLSYTDLWKNVGRSLGSRSR